MWIYWFRTYLMGPFSKNKTSWEAWNYSIELTLTLWRVSLSLSVIVSMLSMLCRDLHQKKLVTKDTARRVKWNEKGRAKIRFVPVECLLVPNWFSHIWDWFVVIDVRVTLSAVLLLDWESFIRSIPFRRQFLFNECPLLKMFVEIEMECLGSLLIISPNRGRKSIDVGIFLNSFNGEENLDKIWEKEIRRPSPLNSLTFEEFYLLFDERLAKPNLHRIPK